MGAAAAGAIGLSGWLGGAALDYYVNQERMRQLQESAGLIEAVVRREGDDDPSGTATALARARAAEGTHVTTFDIWGRIGIDTSGQAVPTLLLGLPEVRQALRPGAAWGTDRRLAGPEARSHLMVARQIARDDGTPIGVVWLSRPAWTVWEWGVGRLWAALAPPTVVAAVAGGLVGVFWHLRFRRRVLWQAIQTIRQLSLGATVGPEAFLSAAGNALGAGGSGTVPALKAALHGLQRRLAADLDRLDRRRRMLQAVVEQLGEGVIVAEADGRLVLVNPAAGRLLGLPASKLSGGGERGPAVESVISQHPLQRLLLQTGARVAPAPVRLKVDGPDGPVWLRAWGSDVQLPDGESTGRVVVLTDVTDLEGLLQVRTDFVANASHELRTPLSTIRAAIETLLGMDLAAEAPQARGFLEKVARQTRRLEQLVLDLLSLSRLENPVERFEPEPIDGKQWLDEIYSRFAGDLESKPLQWRGEFVPNSAVEWRVNALLLNLVADNLIDNAIKFTPAGGQVGLRIEVGRTESVVEVSDTGCGIPAEEQERVFERFYQVERSRSGPQRGTGLGLSIVRHAVAAMGGTVRLESAVGSGTRVAVRIPQAAGD